MPGNRQVFSAAMNAADRYRWDSQWEEAAREYQRALAEFPDDAMARGGLGFCYMQTRQWPEALNEYEYTIKRDPGNVIALSKTAELYGILNRREDAYKAYLHLADLYSQAGQGARAEAAWQKAVQLSPSDPEPHERLAAYYAGKKDVPMMLQERLAAAQGYLARQDIAAARAQCEEILRVDGQHKQAQHILSQITGGKKPSGSLPQDAGASFLTTGSAASSGSQSGPLAYTDSPTVDKAAMGNISGGNTGIMGNMGSAGNFGGANGQSPAMAGGMAPSPHGRITASQVTGVLRQAQTFQTQGRFTDAIDLCEQILQSGFDRPDARYFLGWLYQEQQRWDEAIQQFQMLLNDPDYALSCFYALGQCYRAKGDLRSATMHFDEAVDRVNLDALTMEESDQLVQLCQEAAEAHRQLGEQEQALTVYSALLGFLRSRGWSDKVAQVEFMLQQMQNTPAPARPVTPQPQQQPMTAPPMPTIPDAATMAFNMGAMQNANVPPPASTQLPPPATGMAPTTNGSVGELPDWLTGILSDADKTQLANNKPAASVPPARPAPPAPVQPDAMLSPVVDQPTREQPLPGPAIAAAETSIMNPVPAPPAPAAPSWLTEDAKPGNATRIIPPEPATPEPVRSAPAPAQEAAPPASAPAPAELSPVKQVSAPLPVEQFSPVLQNPVPPTPESAAKSTKSSAEDLLSQMAGANNKDEVLKQVAEAVVTSTASLPDDVRLQVVRSMRDIQNFINHGLLTPAIEECLRVIDIAPQYLDVHQVLCEIYVRQGKVEQAITKYAILVDTYVVNGRIDDAIATYRRILQLEPNNLTYRMRLINLLATQGNKEDLLRERTLAAESYLRLGYMDRALTELEQALQESPTSVPTRLNYALALQKLGRVQQAVAEYQRVLQVDPRNITALVRWHIAMITTLGSARATTLEGLSRIRWQLRGEGQRNFEMVVREYNSASEIYPNNADVQFALGQLYQQTGSYDRAIDAYMLAMRDSSAEVLARVSAAHCLLAQGKPEAAIQQLEQALQQVRTSKGSVEPTAWAARPREEGEEHQAPEVEISMLLAKAYGRTGRQEQMETILRQVKQSTTYQDEVSSAIAEISARQGDMDGALDEFIELVAQYRSKRQGDNALSVLKEMVKLAPQDPRAHRELADIYVSRGLLDEAIAELRLLADISLRHNRMVEAGAAIQQIGNIYAETGDMEEALSNMRRAYELTPDSMELLREMVGYCVQLGRTEEAGQYQAIIAHHYFDTQQVKESVAALQQLIAIDRNNLEAYDLLGQTYQSVGEYEQASRVYRNLAKLNPDSPIARERLSTLQELRATN
ncbi:MAG TPA: tetratricopeptide repeat protein [Ktedonobacteraceae bacterium]|nr:tetratricopeptide repeat protein [Ktedonobacteraceae bacterium]